MARIDWHIQGFGVTSCNCAWGCPCQFNSLPTQGNCHACVGFHVERGHFGKIPLDGLSFAGLFAWPKAIHQGNGEAQPVVDVRANEAQRDALLKIMSGEETDPGATIFSAFAATYGKVHTPLFRPIRVEADFAARTGRILLEGVAEVHLEPMRNPVTGAPAYAKIVLPDGFEYEEAECASSTVRTLQSPIPLQWQGRYGHIARLDMTGSGLVRKRSAA